MSPRAGISIPAEEYDAFVRLIPDHERLPRSHDDWIKRRSQEDAQCVARGEIVKQVVIHYQEFVEYCRATGQQPNYFILGALAAEKAARNT